VCPECRDDSPGRTPSRKTAGSAVPTLMVLRRLRDTQGLVGQEASFAALTVAAGILNSGAQRTAGIALVAHWDGAFVGLPRTW
jgi:hypothetical protein